MRSATKNILGLPLDVFTSLAARAGLPAEGARIVHSQVHKLAVQSIDDLDISQVRRKALRDKFHIEWGSVVDEQAGEDGTRKWLLEFGPGVRAETVFIPEGQAGLDGTPSRGVVCVSSQVGCSLACKFCHTGTQKLKRNLSASEIVAQVMHVRHALGDHGRKRTGDNLVSNVVFMGQGEPLYNWRNVSAAAGVMTATSALNIAAKRVTISTSGIPKLMPRVGSELNCNLALSLHGTNNRLRSSIMGINDTYPLEMVMQACREYSETRARGRKVLFEYTMLAGVNDSPEQAAELIDLVQGLKCHINLIPFNPWPGAPFECSDDDTIMAFGKQLLDAGLGTTIRWPKGRDIMAACGQLRSEHLPTEPDAEGHQ
jgi:23S rRNA (adenine2503-C2)-methyltransferase